VLQRRGMKGEGGARDVAARLLHGRAAPRITEAKPNQPPRAHVARQAFPAPMRR